MKHLSLFLLAASLPLWCACGKKPDAAARLDTFPVKTVPAQRRDLEETILLVGSIKAKYEATLFSRVPGKLKENLLKEGEAVSKGQAVALVERDEVGVRFEPAPVPSTSGGRRSPPGRERDREARTPAFPPAFVAAGPRRRLYHDAAWTRAAIVTCGGLCPGINDVIKALVNTLYFTYGVDNVFCDNPDFLV